jgi:hypothetical protein
VKQRIPKVVTFIMGAFALFLSPVLLAPTALVFVILAIIICPGVRATTVVGCQNCESNVCPWALAILLFVALPLAIVSVYLFRRRKVSKL